MGNWPPGYPAPLASMVGPLDGGITIPKRALDDWSMSTKPPRTQLNGAITNVQTTITVDPIPANGTIPNGFVLTPGVVYPIRIDNELMLATSPNPAGLTWNVVRHAHGTAAAAHADAAIVVGDATTDVVFLGDSTVEATVGTTDDWPQRFTRMLGRTLSGGWLGRGTYPLYRSDNNALIGGGAFNSSAEWTQAGTGWALVAPGGVTDAGPFGWALTANGAGQILIWTRPADVQVAQIDLLVGSGNCSYSTNGGGAWVDAAGGITGQRIPIVIANPTDFRVRAATAAGVATTPTIIGIDVWSSAVSFGTTQGVKGHNFGKDGDFLDVFCRANASGDDFAFLDGRDYAINPDLVIVGPFTNDVLYGPSDPTFHNYLANMTSVITRVQRYADVIVMAYCEQNPAVRGSGFQAQLRELARQAAANTGSAFLSLYDAFAAEGLTGFAACNAEGLMGSDTHLSQLGDNEVAARLMRMCALTTL